jgi:Leucine-rich repeat (LRR) protein
MEYLNFSNIKFTQLQKLYLYDCTAIMFIGYLADNSKLRLLSVRTCSTAATAIKSIKKLDCRSISILKIGNELSDRFYNVTNVNSLNIENLHSTKILPQFLNLERLDLSGSSISSLPLSLNKLQKLSLKQCNHIVSLEIILEFRCLKQLEIKNCLCLQKFIIEDISSFE